MKISVSDYIVATLSNFGVKQAFCVTGGAISHLMESLRKSKINTLHNHHEQACAMAADSYARIAKTPALVLCTNGPGVTNLITGVAGAFQDSIPMIVITGQVPTKQMLQNSKFRLRQLGVQEIITEPFASAITKAYLQILKPEEVVDKLQYALDFMVEGRMGPVWLEIPLDIQTMEIEINSLTHKSSKASHFEMESNLDYLCAKIVYYLRESQRPLLVVGNGVHLSNTEHAFKKFFNKCKIPAVSTWLASDLFSSNEDLYIGNFGILGQRTANYAVQRADLLIILGARLSVPNIGYNTELFAPNAKKIMVDIDVNELLKETISIDLRINQDLRDLIPCMYEQLECITYIDKWISSLKNLKLKLSLCNEESITNTDYIDSYDFIELLSNSITGDEIIVTDMGTSFTCTMQAFKNNGKNRLLTSSSLSSMGFGLPGAIGAACAASKTNKVVCISGDGGMQMNLQELQTIIDNRLDIKIFVLNSQGYLAISIMQDNSFNSKYFGSNLNSGVGAPSFVEIATAYGLKTSKLNSNKLNASQEIEMIINSKGAYVCEVPISSKQVMRPRVQSIKQHNGTFTSSSIEHMWPYLSNNIMQEIEDLMNSN